MLLCTIGSGLLGVCMGPEHDGPVRPRALALPDRDAAEDHLARRDPDSPDLGRNVPFYGLDHFAVRQVVKSLISICSTAVECLSRDREVVGSHPVGCLALFFSSLS